MTSCPLCARYHALVVPMTPAPRTITLMPASDKKHKGESSPYLPPVLAPKLRRAVERLSADSLAAIRPLLGRRHRAVLPWKPTYTLNLPTTDKPFAQGS